ncbi:MAG: hypothetical protein IKW39_02870 [Alphaproteobacteria bacterium]|nr:hypothetical protein [Alphaproteobacteria bacterium]
MNKKTLHRFYLSVLLVTAVVLCTLPFIMFPKGSLYIYTKHVLPDNRETEFVNELEQIGYRVYINKETIGNKKTAIWFKDNVLVKDIIKDRNFEYNFIYNENYYPLNFSGLKTLPIILTPHQKLYEHYMRSNVKSATFYLGNFPNKVTQTNMKTPVEDDKTSAKASAKRFDELYVWLKNNSN